MASTNATAASSEQGDVVYVPRNFWAWVAYQFFYRIGWQFKMESTLMAGLISYLTQVPTAMGLFTAANNVGKNLSPLLAAPVTDRFASKKRALLLFWWGTVASWGVLTVYLWTPAARNKAQCTWVFGFCYTIFFLFLGASSVGQGALLGKIIPANVRGKAMAVGMALSGFVNVGAILFIYHIVHGGGFREPLNYALSFSLSVLFFLLSGISLLFVREIPSKKQTSSLNPFRSLRHYTFLMKGNRNLRILMLVNIAIGIGGSMLQFYTGYWRLAGTLNESALVLATVFQVAWQSVSCGVFGRVADRFGNRHVICWLLWVEASVPFSALILGGWEPFRSSWFWFLGVYTLVGIRFPIYQLLVNYLLEIVEQKDHAQAVGAVTAVQLLTAPAPILLGLLAETFGYQVAFLVAGSFGIYAAHTARSMREVRVVGTGWGRC